MTKYYGMIGYGETSEIRPGVFDDIITERPYRGDVLRNSRRFDSSDKVNDNLSVGNSISIVAAAYAYNHFFSMKYIEWSGTRWEISEVTVERPRLILSLGGVYNGPTA